MPYLCPFEDLENLVKVELIFFHQLICIFCITLKSKFHFGHTSM